MGIYSATSHTIGHINADTEMQQSGPDRTDGLEPVRSAFIHVRSGPVRICN